MSNEILMSSREIPSPRDASHEASMIVALQAAGIEPTIRRTSIGSVDRIGYSHIFVPDDEYERACAAVADLQDTPLVQPNSGVARVVRITGLAVIVVLVVRAGFYFIGHV